MSDSLTTQAEEPRVVPLTKHQRAAIEMVHDRFQHGEYSVTLGGLAGTGKTTVVGQIHRYMGLDPSQIAYCSFTGKAAMVMCEKLGAPLATTIHRLIYRAVETHCKACPAYVDPISRRAATAATAGTAGTPADGASDGGGPAALRAQQQRPQDEAPASVCHGEWCGECRTSFVLRENLGEGLRLIVVDEASMVPRILYDHLLLYGIPILWVGDHGQLPPVKGSAFLMEDPDVVLRKIHRTAADSPILRMAHHVRNADKLPRAGGNYGEGVTVRRGGNFRISKEELDNGSTVVLVPTNKLRRGVNKAARRTRGFNPSGPCTDDRVVCLRNNPGAGVYNGLTGRISSVESGWLESDYYSLDVILDDGRPYSGRAFASQFLHLRTLNEASRGEYDLWDYGYALTVHKAQGSEWPRVIVVADMASVLRDQKKWLYTAVTRATQELEIIYPE